MNLLTYPHSISSLFLLSWKLYQKNLISILLLTLILLAPAMLIGMGGWFETESIVLFVSVHVLEAAITIGIIGLAFGSYFPTMKVLNVLKSPLFLGTVHIGILQYLLFITGVMGLTLPFPMSVLVVALWLGGLLLTTLAQPVFMAEGLRGFRAMTRSIQLCRADLGRVFVVVVFSTLLQFTVFALLFSLFMPELDFNMDSNDPEAVPGKLTEIMTDPGVHIAIRWAQYLASLLFYPFASILTALLYFDLVQRQGGLQMDRLAQYSNHLFGTAIPSQTEKKAATPASSEKNQTPADSPDESETTEIKAENAELPKDSASQENETNHASEMKADHPEKNTETIEVSVQNIETAEQQNEENKDLNSETEVKDESPTTSPRLENEKDK